MSGQYILDEKGNPIEEPDILKWGEWFEKIEHRRVAVYITPSDVIISTVFLGLDHSFGEGAPVLWETMIFGGPHDQYQDRYTSLAAAIEGHDQAVALAKEGERP